jgi:hypothetical protein
MDAVNDEEGDEATVTISSKLHFVDLAGSERLKYIPQLLFSFLGIPVLKVNVQRKEFQSMLVLLLLEKSFLNFLLEVDKVDISPTATPN